MPDQRTVSSEEVRRLLNLEEGHFLDLKRVEIAPGKLSESISAFANTAGGELLIGIGEEADKRSRFWNGFTSMEAANGLFQVIERMSPLSNHYDTSFLILLCHFFIHQRPLLPQTAGTSGQRGDEPEGELTADACD